jgi:hypothetical protein
MSKKLQKNLSLAMDLMPLLYLIVKPVVADVQARMPGAPGADKKAVAQAVASTFLQRSESPYFRTFREDPMAAAMVQDLLGDGIELAVAAMKKIPRTAPPSDLASQP